MNCPDNLSFPVITLDFEASSLAPQSYPIEIGISIWKNWDANVESWSCLIQETLEWKGSQTWNDESQKVHGIKRSDLQFGLEPKQAMDMANRIIGKNSAYCDGGRHDLYWLMRLCQATATLPAFRLESLSGFISTLNEEIQTEFFWQKHSATPSHRARADAEFHIYSLLRGLGIERTFSNLDLTKI